MLGTVRRKVVTRRVAALLGPSMLMKMLRSG
jgi:hypothetical protein